MSEAPRLSKEDEDDPLVIDEDAAEKEFEPSVEMMVNDFDDERTLEEEEALGSRDEAAELDALNQEQDIPIEDLLKMYGYEGGGVADPAQRSSVEEGGVGGEGGKAKRSNGEQQEEQDEITGQGEEADAEEEEEEEEEEKSRTALGGGEDRRNSGLGKKRPLGSPSSSPKKSKSELTRFYESTLEGRSLRSATTTTTTSTTNTSTPSNLASSNINNNPPEEDSEHGEEGEAECDAAEGRDFSWKKTIMIGPSFQASVPPGLCKYYGDSLPYENEDKQLWDPRLLSPVEVEDYLSKSHEAVNSNNGGGGNGVGGLPTGAHIRDDEQALFLLFQCGYNYEEALRRRRMNVVSPADTMSLWSEEECRSFELGLRLYGKDFTMIQQQKVRTRSVGEIVQFYYLWKKTERHDVFANANRLEKKKYTLHPGTTDYMDRFIDEQDSSRDRSSSPNYHSLLYGANNHPPGDSSTGGTFASRSNSPTNSGLNKSSFPSSSSNGSFPSNSHPPAP
eukprot:TRINITY_DN2523_c0_g2_i1.p1 TRINITY_DN2523_c0_g2~~TRINITY_DN2523_c0_g2_i1.p1  ORF type:complete len:505 (+),score=190.26 TRINITY_DN2523_c0_g2_i1:131-1645(+)